MKKFSTLLTAVAFIFSISVMHGQEMAKKDHMHGSDKMEKMQTMDKMDKEVRIIELQQEPGVYTTTSLQLEPGKYIFKVTNKNVDKKLGFYLTTAGGEKTQVKDSGLAELVKLGENSESGVVTLEAGSYEYSCPLNPTPKYNITVK